MRQPLAVPPLRAVREAQGLGLRETARRAGIDHAQLSRIERGEEGLSLATLARLAPVLGLTELERLLSQYLTPTSAKPAETGLGASRVTDNADPTETG